MKKKKLIILAIVLVIAAVLLMVYKPWGEKPFKDLSVDEIQSVSVKLVPPDETFSLSSDEITELTNILNLIVIYAEDNSYDQYAGQAVIYEITKNDGSVLEVNAYNPFLIIDGTSYKTKYRPCEELNSLGNRIRNDE
ncbi:MAG: hypothetical protein R3Y09_00665 [Clostridia bacterium]